MTEFKKGGRVVYVGNLTQILKCGLGTVLEQESQRNVLVDWDEHPEQTGGVLPENLKLICENKTTEKVEGVKMTKQEFIDKYQGVQVNCKTEELAKEFLALAHEFGWKWPSGDSLLREKNHWLVNKEKTLYRAWSNGDMTYKHSLGCDPEEFVVFESLKHPTQLPQPQKSLLKSGDKVVYRDGDERYVLVETGTLHDKYGDIRNHIKHYNDRLTSCGLNLNDIMQVYRKGELIMQRVEKSEKELRKEELQRSPVRNLKAF